MGVVWLTPEKAAIPPATSCGSGLNDQVYDEGVAGSDEPVPHVKCSYLIGCAQFAVMSPACGSRRDVRAVAALIVHRQTGDEKAAGTCSRRNVQTKTPTVCKTSGGGAYDSRRLRECENRKPET